MVCKPESSCLLLLPPAYRFSEGACYMLKRSKDEQEIIKLERDFFNALLKHDKNTVDKILAEDFVLTDPGDVCLTKSQWIEYISSGNLKFNSLTIDHLRVQMMGEVAAAHGQLTVTSQYKAQSKRIGYNGRFAYTDVYQKRDGHWQMILATGNRTDLSS